MVSSVLAREYIHQNRGIVGGIILIGVLHSCVTFLLPVSIGDFFILQYGASGSRGRLLGLLGIHFSTLPGFFAFFMILVVLKALTGMAEKWLSLREGERFVKRIRDQLFERQLRTDPEIFGQRHYGNYLLRYSNDLKVVKNYLRKGVLERWKNLVFLLVGLSLLGMIHFRLTVYLLILFILMFTAVYFFARYQQSFIRESRSRRSGLLAFVTRNFSRHSKIRELAGEESVVQRFNQKSGALFQANMKNNRLESLQESLVPLMQFTMLGMLLWVSTVIKPAINYSDALVYVLVTIMLLSSMRRILKLPGTINKGNISLQKIGEILVPSPPRSSPHKEGVLSS